MLGNFWAKRNLRAYILFSTTFIQKTFPRHWQQITFNFRNYFKFLDITTVRSHVKKDITGIYATITSCSAFLLLLLAFIFYKVRRFYKSTNVEIPDELVSNINNVLDQLIRIQQNIKPFHDYTAQLLDCMSHYKAVAYKRIHSGPEEYFPQTLLPK